MEQAVNQFTHGLQIDTNPMILGTDTLTDCLNGTIVTMSGNEITLQNDMGNRKIDSAFLPSGYQPIGIKEYGGIIYIAAYNPITNRSQIGSFPSPLRNSGKESNLESTVDFDTFVDNNVIKYESILKSLTDKTILHAGDKFKICSININDFLEFVKNNDDKLNLFTLLVGVLNSQNEFIDITKSLKSYDNNYYICQAINTYYNFKSYADENEINEYASGKVFVTGNIKIFNSEEYIEVEVLENTVEGFVGKKYYIISSAEVGSEKYQLYNSEGTALGIYIKIISKEYLNLALDDLNLEEYREGFKNMNIYSYKMVSPLYLKTTINYPKNALFLIYAESENNEWKFTIDMTCNHSGVLFSYNNDDIDLVEYIPKITINNNVIDNITTTIDTTAGELEEKNLDNGLYIAKYKYEFTISDQNNNTNYIDGLDSTSVNLVIEQLLFDKGLFYNNSIITTGEKYEVTLNLNKMGSDTIELNENTFQYYNDLENDIIKFKFNLIVYPKKSGSQIKGIYWSLNNLLLVNGPDIKSGLIESTTVLLDLLLKNRAYNLNYIYYTREGDIDENLLYNKYKIVNSFIFIGTELFNGNYNGLGVLRLGFSDSDGNNGLYDYDQDANSYISNYSIIKHIKLPIEAVVENNVSYTTDTNVDDYESNYSKYSLIETRTVTDTCYYTLKIKNEELYPDNLNISNYYESIILSEIDFKLDNTVFTKLTIVNNNITLLSGINIETIKNLLLDNYNNLEINNIITINTPSITGSTLLYNLKIKNIWIGNTSNQDFVALNVITSFRKFLDEENISVTAPYYCIDYEGDHNPLSIGYVSNDFDDPTNVSPKLLTCLYEEENLPYEYNYGLSTVLGINNMNLINNYLSTYSGRNLFVAERNHDDIIKITSSNYFSTVGEQIGKGYVRIWFLYKPEHFIPCIIQVGDYNNPNLLLKNKLLDYANKIPHYYAYKTQTNNEFLTGIIKFDNNTVVTKNFEYILNLDFTLSADINSNNVTNGIVNGIFKIESITNLTFNVKLFKIQTNNNFIQLLNCIKEKLFNTVCNYGLDLYILTDNEGNLLSRKNVYKLTTNNGKTFLLFSYIPDIVNTSINNNYRIPNLLGENLYTTINNTGYEIKQVEGTTENINTSNHGFYFRTIPNIFTIPPYN